MTKQNAKLDAMPLSNECRRFPPVIFHEKSAKAFLGNLSTQPRPIPRQRESLIRLHCQSRLFFLLPLVSSSRSNRSIKKKIDTVQTGKSERGFFLTKPNQKKIDLKDRTKQVEYSSRFSRRRFNQVGSRFSPPTVRSGILESQYQCERLESLRIIPLRPSVRF